MCQTFALAPRRTPGTRVHCLNGHSANRRLDRCGLLGMVLKSNCPIPLVFRQSMVSSTFENRDGGCDRTMERPRSFASSQARCAQPRCSGRLIWQRISFVPKISALTSRSVTFCSAKGAYLNYRPLLVASTDPLRSRFLDSCSIRGFGSRTKDLYMGDREPACPAGRRLDVSGIASTLTCLYQVFTM